MKLAYMYCISFAIPTVVTIFLFCFLQYMGIHYISYTAVVKIFSPQILVAVWAMCNAVIAKCFTWIGLSQLFGDHFPKVGL